MARGIEEAVYQAIYTKEAAKVQTAALAIHNAHFSHTLEGKIDIEAGGKIKSGKAKGEGDLKYLTERQNHDTWESIQATVARPWALMCEFGVTLAFMIASCSDSIALISHTLSHFFPFLPLFRI